MSDASDLSAGLLNAMGDEGGTADQGYGGPDSTGASQPSAGLPGGTVGNTYDTTGLSPYAQNWLTGIPEGERVKAAEYVKNWDQGFQQYAMRMTGQLKPYSDLGSPEELGQLKQAFEYMQSDPQGFVEALVERGLVQLPGQSPVGNGQQPGNTGVSGAQQTPDIVSHPQFKRMEAAIGALSQQMQQQATAREAAEAERALDQVTSDLHGKYGDFNELFVWQLMAQGMNGDAAVQAWRNEVQKAIATQNRPPAIMNASSAPPIAAGPLKSSEDRATALANALRMMGGQ
jgi:hypothetical protein